MINLFKRYDFDTVKYKFKLIYALNVIDILYTIILLRTGKFFEGNIVMQSIVKNEILSIVLKIGLPLLLIYYLVRRMRDATNKQLIIANIFINFCLILYMITNLLHVFWTIFYLISYS